MISHHSHPFNHVISSTISHSIPQSMFPSLPINPTTYKQITTPIPSHSPFLTDHFTLLHHVIPFSVAHSRCITCYESLCLHKNRSYTLESRKNSVRFFGPTKAHSRCTTCSSFFIYKYLFQRLVSNSPLYLTQYLSSHLLLSFLSSAH